MILIGDNRYPRGKPITRWIIIIGYPSGIEAGAGLDIINGYGYGFTKTRPEPDPLPSLAVVFSFMILKV